jgi:hypothetical protein
VHRELSILQSRGEKQYSHHFNIYCVVSGERINCTSWVGSVGGYQEGEILANTPLSPLGTLAKGTWQTLPIRAFKVVTISPSS